MAFEGLSGKLNNVFGKLKGRGKLNEKDIKDAMREVRMALLDADGAESDLPFTVEDEELSFTLDFTPVEDEEPVPVRLIRLIPIAE